MGKKNWLSLVDMAVVLLITAALFRWAKTAALRERGLEACGGEYLLLLIPPLYYIIKQSVSDMIADLQSL